MRKIHERIAAIGLREAEDYGFVLAGGYAISANGMGDRPSMDVDFGFEFADEHRAFLAAGLPLDESGASQDPGGDGPETWGWPDWHDGHPDDLRACLDKPSEGVLFQVEHAGFWHPHMGPAADRHGPGAGGRPAMT